MPSESLSFTHGPCWVRIRKERGAKENGEMYHTARERKSHKSFWSGWAVPGSPELIAAVDKAIEENEIEPYAPKKSGRPPKRVSSLRDSINELTKTLDEPQLVALYAHILSESSP